jgi:uncharacterized membrane protein
MLIPFPIVFFVSTLVTDLVARSNGDPFWSRVSVWLLGAGLVMAALAALAGLTDFLSSRSVRSLSHAWLHMIGNVVAVVLELVNFLLRYRTPEAVPSGLAVAISAVVVVLLLFNGWMGWELVYRDHVGVSDD